MNVRGNIILLKNGNDVGTAARPLTSLNVGGASGCKFRANPYHTPCTSVDHTRPNSTVGSSIAQPVANFIDWYTVASPGPTNPCEVVSGTPPTFDTDGIERQRCTDERRPPGHDGELHVSHGARRAVVGSSRP